MKDIVELREVKGHPGIFVTRTPQFVSLRGKVKILPVYPPCRTERYPRVFIDGKNYRIHLLVAEAFPELVEGERQEGYELDHRNGKTTDARPENLRWVTHKENLNNPETRYKIGRKGSKPVFQYTKTGILVGSFHSAAAAERNTGIKHNSICWACLGKRKTAGGYIWSYDKSSQVGI